MLKHPVGARQVVDVATGQSVHYVDQVNALVPTWLPAGFDPDGGVEPSLASVWSQEFLSVPVGPSQVRQHIEVIETVGDGLPEYHAPNTSVNGHPAYQEADNAWQRQLDWSANGSQFTILADTINLSCEHNSPGSCPATPDASTVTTAQLKRIAEGLRLPSSR